MDGMSTGQEIALYLITFVIFAMIDLPWVTLIAKARYDKALKKVYVKEPVMHRVPILISVYVLGLVVMVLVPAVNEDSLGIAMFRGAAFGFFTFATFNLKNWVMVKNWATRITFEDIAWGTFLGFAVSTFSYNVYSALFF